MIRFRAIVVLVALALLAGGGATVVGASAGAASKSADPAPAPLKFTYPGAAWRLVISLPGFQLGTPKTRADGTGMALRGENLDTGTLVSIFLEKAARRGDAKACRDYYWNDAGRGPERLKKVRKYERGEMAIVEYVLPEFQGIKVDQRNVNAYLAHDGIWIDVHLSKVGFTSSDQKSFDAILDSVGFEAAPPAEEGEATRP